MNGTQLKAFHAVARMGGFTAAARALGLTQPAVTHQVRSLERAYDVQLFYRIGRTVSLTSTGKVLYGLARRIQALETEAEEYLRAVGGFSTGQVRIAADGPYHLISILSALKSTLPGLDLKVAMGNSDAVLHALEDYEAEIGVLGNVVLSDRFSVLRESRHPIVLVVARDHPWAARGEVDVTEIAAVEMVMREEGSSTRRLFEQGISARGVVPKVALELGSREAVKEAVAAGLGVGVVQADELAGDHRLASVEVRGVDLVAGEFVVCLRERMEAPLLRRIRRELPHHFVPREDGGGA